MSDCNSTLTAEILRAKFHYVPETGQFWRHVYRNGKHAVSVKSGHHHRSTGYINIYLNGQCLLAHRLAWLYVHGVHPKNQIDHINGNRIDNRMQNLRDATPFVNQQNRHNAPKSNRFSGLLGAAPKGKKWSAQICVNGKPKHLGTFETPENAHQAYLEAKRELHEGCTI